MSEVSEYLSRWKWRAVAGAALIAASAAAPVPAATCQFIGGPQFGGIEPPLAVDATCIDPDYNDQTFVTDSTEQKSLQLPDGTSVSYTELKGHFPATRSQAELPAGITQSPTTVSHKVLWQFPEKKYFRNRFFQQTYPLEQEILNTVDKRFAFVTGGGYTVGIVPGSPNVGYRVSAAAAKLAKAYANKLYGNTGRIYGYMYGQSGGSVQTIGAAEGTTGVWDGLVPVVIATDALNVHSFMWDALYALAVPEAKRQAIADAAAPGSGSDIYAGLTSDERAVLDELLNAGFPRNVLETMHFSAGVVTLGASAVRSYDPSYEEDFWSKPGYEGTNPPTYLQAAKLDGFATITSITRNAQSVPIAITFDPSTVPALGSIGSTGLQFYVYAADGTTQVTQGDAVSLSGKLENNTLTLKDGDSNPALLAALATGGRVRINNRFTLAAVFYPRHSILDNGNPAYRQYMNADGTPKYIERPPTPFPVAFINNMKTSGGIRQTGRLKVKTVVFENLADGNSYPYVAGFYAQMVTKALGSRETDKMFRVYYQENGIHGAFLDNLPGKFGTSVIPTGGILHQVLLDLADWAERGVAPRPSTRYRIDSMNQVVVPSTAKERGGLQPLVHLTVNGKDRAEVSLNQPVNLVGKIEMPPGAGKIVEYDYYVGSSDYKFEPATKLSQPQTRVSLTRTISFPKQGEYVIALRTAGQRDGKGDASGTTPLINIDRVRVVVR
jgi:hypothetical protein